MGLVCATSSPERCVRARVHMRYPSVCAAATPTALHLPSSSEFLPPIVGRSALGLFRVARLWADNGVRPYLRPWGCVALCDNDSVGCALRCLRDEFRVWLWVLSPPITLEE